VLLARLCAIVILNPQSYCDVPRRVCFVHFIASIALAPVLDLSHPSSLRQEVLGKSRTQTHDRVVELLQKCYFMLVLIKQCFTHTFALKQVSTFAHERRIPTLQVELDDISM